MGFKQSPQGKLHFPLNRAKRCSIYFQNMPQQFYAGGDWSGKAETPDEPFIFCVTALNDAEAWDEACLGLRTKLRMKRDKEFHGHLMNSDTHRLEVLQLARRLDLRVGALILLPETKFLESVTLSYQNIALELVNRFFPQLPLRDLWCDTEIEGKSAQQAFETALKRCYREIHPGSRFNARVRESHTSNLIQLADIMAYTLRRQTMGKIKNSALRQFLKEVASDTNNLIVTR